MKFILELAQEAKEKGIAWVPTMLVHFWYLEYIEQIKGKNNGNIPEDLKVIYKLLTDAAASFRENFRKCYNTGIRIAAGTDIILSGKPVTPVSKELEMMADMGLSPLEAIECGTSTAAELLNLQSETGIIKEGLTADLLVVKGNPVHDIKCVQDVVAVYRDGELAFLNK